MRALFYLAALAVLVPALLAGLSLSQGCHGPTRRRLNPLERARSHCRAVAERLHARRRPDGWHDRASDPEEADEWGNPLRVEYRRWVENGQDIEACVVRGAGPDGEWGTADDVAAPMYLVRPAGR